jgi:sterol desaturase/sphingolipid hydroxylase (fatty acid hydroxylase superfamily)
MNPLNEPTLYELFLRYVKVFTIASLRYALFAGVLYVIFYVWKKRHFLKAKIQQKFPDNKHIAREISYSLLSVAIFALVGTTLFYLRKSNIFPNKIYTDLSEHSVGYFIFSVLLFIVAHDTYFYWTHRFMHIKKIYPYVHKIHHLSVNPTPWAAFAFHPVEAVIEIGILPIMTYLIPLHPLAILTWVLYQSAMNVIGHYGFELFPKGFTSGTITKWHNTSTHHNMHHKHVTSNFGLYFNFWDRIMGTNHDAYDEVFNAVVERRQSSEADSEETEQATATA